MTCMFCTLPVAPRRITCGSVLCDATLARAEAATGVCGWCNRFGPRGATCVRTVPGTTEVDECGTFR